MFRPFSFRTLTVTLLLLVMHLPFMLSDPDPQVSLMSRGPWTDEGLNTVQVRNFVNHGNLAIGECDNLIKTPFFGFSLVPFYALLGTELWVGRAVVLLSVLLMLWAMLAYRPTRSFAIAFAFLGLMQFHLFHYAHYSMAEMMGVALLLLGIFMLRLAYGLEHRAWYAAASLAFGLAFLSKVTFAYALLLPFVARYFLFLSERTRGRDSMRDLLTDTFIMAVVTGSFVSLFYFKWYKVHKDVFDLVKADQGNDRFDLVTAWERVQFNWDNYISIEGFAPFLVLGAMAFTMVVRTSERSRGDRSMLFGLLAWLLLESHRLLLVNPPSRYLVPLFAAMLAFTAFGITQWKEAPSRRFFAILFIIGFSFYNLSHYRDSLNRRTFVMEDIRAYLASYDLRNEKVLGVWATGVADRGGAYALPVWNGFMNHIDPLATHDPRVVMTEHDEGESSGAFRDQGIDLFAVADSVRTYDIWRYRVNLFWLTGKQKMED
jgi:4-amino-4-deoxy-L-arabinose transferase-like glycosyltransferase